MAGLVAWAEDRGLELQRVEPMHVAAFVEQPGKRRAPATVKQHLTALRMLFDYLVVGQVLPTNPASAVRGRNLDRFPGDFMFQLSKKELEDWRSQIVMSNPGAKMGLRRRPYAFTEHGILMLSSVLRSPRAVQVNIEIMRIFVRLRRMLASHEDLARKLAALERKYDAKFRVVFDALRNVLQPTGEPPKRPIGFRSPRE